MKKIAIVTFHYPENRNYGAILQTFAINQVYKKIGLYTKIIDFFYNKYTLKQKILLLLEKKKFWGVL